MSDMGEIVTAMMLLAFSGIAQGTPDPLAPLGTPVRFRVQHADPYAIVAMLQGQQIPYPELSTLAMFGFQLPQGAQAGQSFVPEGTFIVNPTDNSIWYLPRR